MSRQPPGLAAPTSAGAIPAGPPSYRARPHLPRSPPTSRSRSRPRRPPPLRPPTTSQCRSRALHRLPADEAEPSRAAGAAEIAALLASPPEWLDGPRDAGLSALATRSAARSRATGGWRGGGSARCAARRARRTRASTIAWSYVCCSAPAVAPKLSVLSIVHHLDIEVRDPYEGDLEDPFYEELARRAGLADEVDAFAAAAEAAAAAANLRRRPARPVQRRRRRVGDGRVTAPVYRARMGQGRAVPGAAGRRPPRVRARRHRPPHPTRAGRAAAEPPEDEAAVPAAPAPAASRRRRRRSRAVRGALCSSSSSRCCRPARGEARVELQLAWDRIAGRHGDQLADARRYRGCASTQISSTPPPRRASGSTTRSPPRSTPATPTRWRRRCAVT